MCEFSLWLQVAPGTQTWAPGDVLLQFRRLGMAFCSFFSQARGAGNKQPEHQASLVLPTYFYFLSPHPEEEQSSNGGKETGSGWVDSQQCPAPNAAEAAC